MEDRSNELAITMPILSTLPAMIKEEHLLEQHSSRQDSKQSQDVSILEEEEEAADEEEEDDECGVQNIECTTEGQESEIRVFLSKCIFCSKIFTDGDESKLLECLHAACTTCVSNKLSDHNASVDVDVLCMYPLILISTVVPP